MIQYLIGAIASVIIVVPLAYYYYNRGIIRKTKELEKRTIDSERLAFAGTLAGGLAHEIKNPLSTLNIHLQLLKEDLQNIIGASGDDTRKVYRKIEIIQKEALRLEEILNDFLRFAKGQKLELEYCAVNEILDEVINFATPEIKQKNVVVLKSYHPGLPLCYIDSKLIKQAFLNVIINAQQAMEHGGELMIRTSKVKKSVQIDITDTGHGISNDSLNKIFQVYYSTKTAGTGLGLPTTKKIIEEHRGTISVQSQEGKGTNFTIQLPINLENVSV
ncbi:MAG: hypothetical protein K8F34_06490 [Candidatus Kuenenia stuttgartiensis]|nr:MULTISPECIES: ATP-binding protein [Kuenenia]MBE7546113.1 two-component sensor histidine kinase [Planctomycetia bacterium]MBZ0191323.1 hypothetical protein [Candidatus Kuenenia stuttgartiensis]MCF6153272.1 two-component sensor histidine kinase [Candidatus Kuenenia stuttgartiensis]MCL4726395.1 hypothetical protein [Candidatus Kuenenia stuttgartiensis]MCZ7621621.1 ATP-binding protein [Candidatus Kuenenia sp.]